MLNQFLEKLGLVVEKKFTEGNRCQGVYLVKKDGTSMILKISDIPSEVAEINRNIIGYESMNKLGLESFSPELYLTGQQEKITFILMEYLGENFECFMKRSGGVKDYSILVDC